MRLSTFARVCLRLRLCVCLRLSAFVCVCFSFARICLRPPLLRPPLRDTELSGPGCCSCPGFRLCLGASDCSHKLAFCFMGPWTFAWICCPQLPYHLCKNGMHSIFFTVQEVTLRFKGALWASAFWQAPKHTRKRNTPENAGNRPLLESAIAGVLRFRVCRGALSEENKEHPKNATHPKTQILGTVDCLRFRVCCVFGRSLFSSEPFGTSQDKQKLLQPKPDGCRPQ